MIGSSGSTLFVQIPVLVFGLLSKGLNQVLPSFEIHRNCSGCVQVVQKLHIAISVSSQKINQLNHINTNEDGNLDKKINSGSLSKQQTQSINGG